MTMIFYVGTYTRLGGPGIAVCSLSGNRLSLLGSELISDPTYVILSDDRQFLYSVSSDPAESETSGAVAAYHIEGSRLVPMSRRGTGGAGPCHLCLSADGRFLYVANYHGGSLAVFPVTASGAGEKIQFIQHQGRSIHPERQQGPHVHQVSFLPGTHLLAVVDLGLDAVLTYAQDCATGLLRQVGRLDCVPGSGPRHLAYGLNDIAYLADELGNKINVLRPQGQSFVRVQTLPTLPENWTGDSFCAAVRYIGRKVFVSNRGHNSLAVFDVLDDGQLQPAGVFPTGGGFPRDFFPLPDGQILVAHQAGDVSLLCQNSSNEWVRAADPLPIPGAVCICPVGP